LLVVVVVVVLPVWVEVELAVCANEKPAFGQIEMRSENARLYPTRGPI
jgi:hypothetical protein